MIPAKTIFQNDIKEYTVERLDSLTTTPDGKQIKNKTSHTLKLAIYNKGKKVVRKEKEDSYTISTIHIYSDVVGSLSLLDELVIDNLTYVVLEEKNKSDFSFYRAVANV